MASVLFESEGAIIRNIMSNKLEGPDAAQMLIILASWYFLTIITYGTNVPSGLFLPGMIVGCAFGSIYADLFLEIPFGWG